MNLDVLNAVVFVGIILLAVAGGFIGDLISQAYELWKKKLK